MKNRLISALIATALLLGTFHAGQAAIEGWSTSAGSNNAAPPDGAPEGQAPSTVNNVIREVMAQVARWAKQQTGSSFGVAGGTATAYTVNPSVPWTSYVSGQTIRFYSPIANTGDATLNVSSLGAVSLVTISSASLVANKIKAGVFVEAVLNTVISQFHITSVGQATQLTVPSTTVSGTVLIWDSTDGASVADSGVTLGGKQTIWIPAGAMLSRTSTGAAIGTTESTTNKVMTRTLDFDGATDEFAQFNIGMPKGWNASTLTFIPHWTAAAGSGTVIFGLQCLSLRNDDAIDAAFGTAQTSTDTITATGDNHLGPESSAITCAGTVSATDNTVMYQIYRDADADSSTNDAQLIGIKLFYTTVNPNDN
jgi:hypothetical protein